MKWPWQKTEVHNHPERATLTLLSDGKVILGTPSNLSDADVQYIREQWENRISGNWDGEWKTVVFPFPIDVVDLR